MHNRTNIYANTISYAVAGGSYYTGENMLAMGMYVCSSCCALNCIDKSFCVKCGEPKFVLLRNDKKFNMAIFIKAQSVLFQKLMNEFRKERSGTRQDIYYSAKKLSGKLFTQDQLIEVVNAVGDALDWSACEIRL